MASLPLFHLLGRRVPRQHFLQAPALQLRERPSGGNPHGIARLGFALFVVRIELLRDAHNSAVLRVLHEAHHFDDDGLFHFRAGDFAHEFGTFAARGGNLCFCCHYAFPAFAVLAPAFSSCARSSVFTRARSFFASRKRFSASDCPVVNWKRRRKICSVSSLCWASSSFTPASRIFSMLRAPRFRQRRPVRT